MLKRFCLSIVLLSCLVGCLTIIDIANAFVLEAAENSAEASPSFDPAETDDNLLTAVFAGVLTAGIVFSKSSKTRLGSESLSFSPFPPPPRTA